MNQMKMKNVKSSSGNIVAAGYDPDQGRMVVKFKGGREYSYDGVPPEEFEKFESTFESDESTGSHFHRQLRGKYDGVLIPEEKEK